MAILTNLLWLKRFIIMMGVSVFNSSFFPSIMSWSNKSSSFHVGLSVSSSICRQRQKAQVFHSQWKQTTYSKVRNSGLIPSLTQPHVAGGWQEGKW